jgi:dTDP-glucose pyrophosphorylase/predicted transcriptional regulator
MISREIMDWDNMARLEELWREACISVNAKIEVAVQNLNELSLRIVLVVDENNKFVGTISDGDVRRGLLKGLNLQSPVIEIVQRKALVVPPDMPRDTVAQLMAANKIHQMPIISPSNQVVGLHIWDEIVAPLVRPNLMIIMAGGLGSRLRPYTENCPKPLLQVAGKPILEHIIERAKLEGFHKFVLATHYLGNMIEDYFGSGERLKVHIEYLRETTPLGTAGALGLLPSRPDEPFVVTNGDVITDIAYGELIDFHSRNAATATMAVRLHEWQQPFGVVQVQGLDIIGFEEKPIIRCHINAGVYVLSPDALDALPANVRCDMPAIFERLQMQSRRVVAYPIHEPWLDVGRPDDLAEARQKYSDRLENSND